MALSADRKRQPAGHETPPLVSIIVPSFNQGAFIRQTIESCLEQDYRPIEIIVMDGASTDNTVDVLESFGDLPELKWVSEPDKGVVNAVNKGLRKAIGEFAAIQSSDDYYLPGAVSACVGQLAENPGLKFVFGDIIKVGEAGEELSRHVLAPYSLENVLSLTTWIPQPGCFFRLEHAVAAGGWREEVPYAADTDLWLRLALSGSALKIDRFIAKRRMHGEQRDVHGDRILRDYSKMIDDLFKQFGADPELRPFAREGLLRQRVRYGRPEQRSAAEGELQNQPKKYPVRQVAGCLLHDVPRIVFSKHWTHVRNRNNNLVCSPDGVDTRPLGNWSEDLYAVKVFPMLGKTVMHRALKQWPIHFSAKRVCDAEPNVTFVIPFRGRERLPLLRRVIESILAQRDVGVRCLVVEQSEQSVAVDLPESVDVLHLPHPSDPNPWRKSWAFNDGVRQAGTEWVVCHDADIPVPADYAKEILRLSDAQGFEVMHLQRFLFCLSQETTAALLHASPKKLPESAPVRIRQNWQGGTVVLRRETYLGLGGFDERFVNWGGEDNEFFDRCRTRTTCYSGFLPFVHLWHPEQSLKCCAARDANLKEMKRLLEIPAEDRIRALGGTA